MVIVVPYFRTVATHVLAKPITNVILYHQLSLKTKKSLFHSQWPQLDQWVGVLVLDTGIQREPYVTMTSLPMTGSACKSSQVGSVCSTTYHPPLGSSLYTRHAGSPCRYIIQNQDESFTFTFRQNLSRPLQSPLTHRCPLTIPPSKLQRGTPSTPA